PPRDAVEHAQDVRIERVHVEGPLSQPVAGGEATRPLVVELWIDDQVVEPGRRPERQDVGDAQDDRERDDAGEPGRRRAPRARAYGVATMQMPHACGAPPMLWLSATVGFFTWRFSALPWSCL